MDNRFTLAPQITHERSKFNRNHQHKTTFNAGGLIPIMVDEVLPADTMNINISSLIRSSTPLAPVMDNAYLDLYSFFVPMRLIWDHWEEFMGANKHTFWDEPRTHKIPQVIAGQGNNTYTWKTNDVADHMGLPINKNASVSALPFRAYELIWNEFFRDQNVQKPIPIETGSVDTYVNFSSGTDMYLGHGQGRFILPVNKYHDYFTSCLPKPQKGGDVTLPVFGGTTDLPVFAGYTGHNVDDGNGKQGIRFKSSIGLPIADGANIHMGAKGRGTDHMMTADNTNVTSTQRDGFIYPDNLWGRLDASKLGGGVKINELRMAFQTQRALERDARSGTRYTEQMQARYGVTNPDARLQRPEFLGGQHIALQQQQVEQTSASNITGGGTPQGNLAAYSLTSDNNNITTKSFTEHGYVICLAAVRTEHTYQNNIERMWNRKERFDFHDPVLNNIGEQAVLNKEIWASGNAGTDEGAFGFQEAWADYRMKPSKVTGQFAAAADQPLTFWHYADNFDKLPMLTSEFMKETFENVDRTLAIQAFKYTGTGTNKVPDLSQPNVNQFIADFYIQNETTRTMPLYSIPGLIDHN